jgi:hypothetical protein
VDALGLEVDSALDRLGHPVMDCLWMEADPARPSVVMAQVTALVRALGLDPVHHMQARTRRARALHVLFSHARTCYRYVLVTFG